VVVLSTQENLGPSEEAEAEFAKELAKMVTDSSAESRKVDKKTALALWDSAVLPPGARKKRVGEGEDNGESELEGQGMMNFTVITKRGNKQQVGFCFRLHIFNSHLQHCQDSSTCHSGCICPGGSYPFRSIARQS